LLPCSYLIERLAGCCVELELVELGDEISLVSLRCNIEILR
jgi:hypothetical protein